MHMHMHVHMQSVGMAVGFSLCFSAPFSCNLSRVCSIRCGPSCVTGPVSAPPRPPSAPQGCPWCRMAAGAALCVPGSWGSPAATGLPATAREACSATTAPVSPGGPANVSVRFPSVWAGPALGPHECNSMCLKSAQQSATGCRGRETLRLLFQGLVLTRFLHGRLSGRDRSQTLDVRLRRFPVARPGSHKTGPAQTATPVFSTLLTWPNSSTS